MVAQGVLPALSAAISGGRLGCRSTGIILALAVVAIDAAIVVGISPDRPGQTAYGGPDDSAFEDANTAGRSTDPVPGRTANGRSSRRRTQR